MINVLMSTLCRNGQCMLKEDKYELQKKGSEFM